VTLPRDLAVYRVAAIVTGVGLLLLVFVAMPLRYLGDEPWLSKTYSPIHGLIFMGYVVVVIWVTTRRHWSPTKALGIILAGVVPFLSFVVERRVIADELAADAAAPAVDSSPDRSSP
jgi:integral membrane protein